MTTENLLDLAEKAVVSRSLEVREAMNAKRYANKYNGKLIAELTKNIEDADLKFAQACDLVIHLRKTLIAEKAGQN